MQSNREVLRCLFIYTNVGILLSVLCVGLPIAAEVMGLSDLPVFSICLAIMVLLLATAGMAMLSSFKAHKISADEQKYLYKFHQMSGRNISALFVLVSLVSFSCVYLFHFDPLIALQIGLLLPLSIGMLNLRLALRMSTV